MAALVSVSVLLLLQTKGGGFVLDKNTVVKQPILAGATFSILMGRAGVATDTAMAILEASKQSYNLSKIIAGKELQLVYDRSGNLTELIYEISRDEIETIKNISTSSIPYWEAKVEPIQYTVEIDKVSGVIEDSLYSAVLSQGLDQRLALAIAEMFAWQIDFATQIQKGDTFKVMYEKKFRSGSYSHPGQVLAAEFTNSGETFHGFYFSSGGKSGYYDENGNSLQKILLKAPLQYKYISSGFSYSRYNPVLHSVGPHRAIDFAAPYGTPIVTVGDGTVTQAGWNGQYGISITVRHNEMYKTIYGHLSRVAVHSGARVRQGSVIGYVGSTGISTGPHLHYEMYRFGTHVNPLTEKIPAGKPIDEADRKAFEELKQKYVF